MQVIFPQQQQQQPEEPAPRNISIPFLRESIGLGDAVANITQAFGVQPCGGCQKRKDALNKRVQLNPYRG
jgi:hypothetical protein